MARKDLIIELSIYDNVGFKFEDIQERIRNLLLKEKGVQFNNMKEIKVQNF